jgi:hypothetical protein
MITPPGAPGGDPPGKTRVEMRGESRDSSTFTQIGTQTNQAAPLPAEAFRPWAELTVPPGLGNIPARAGLFVGRGRGTSPAGCSRGRAGALREGRCSGWPPTGGGC